MSTKFNKRQLPDSTVYNDEETTFQAKVLLPIATPTDDKEAITFKFYKDKREEIDTEISLLKNPDRITVNAGYTLLGQDLTFNPDWKVVIDAVEYTNTAQVILNFPLASAGCSRLDLVAFTKDSTFVRVAGVESLTTPVAPSAPPDTVYVTVVFVSDVSVNEPISSVHNPVTIGTANGLSLSNQQLSLGLASSGVTGALSGTDWNAFNNKQDAFGFTPENVVNKQNSLAVDGTGTKYPTVDAVNGGLALKNELIAHLKFNNADKTIWNNGYSNVTTATSYGERAGRLASGSYWTANGFQAGYSNTTGSNWTANGSQAGYSNTTGSNWTANGSQAGYSNTTGNYWTANGSQAGFFNTTGSNWTANGYRAGGYLANGTSPLLKLNNGVFIGADTKALEDNSINEIVIGYNATGLGSNSSVIGNSSTLRSRIWGRFLSGTSVDDGVNQLQVAGTISASPATTANQVPTWGQVFDGLALKSNIGHTHVASQITDLSKASVGLGNVDNTSDLSKPLSTATINALATKFTTPTGLTTNFLPKWNGSGFGNSIASEVGGSLNVSGELRIITRIRLNNETQTNQLFGDGNAFSVGGENNIGIRNDLGDILFATGGFEPKIILKQSSRVLINKTDDDLTNQLQVAGTISASPATTANQVPTWGQVQAIARPYKVYTALLSQTGTGIPTAIVLENTTGETPTLSRVGIGNYQIHLTVPQTKTFVTSTAANNNYINAIGVNGLGTAVNIYTSFPASGGGSSPQDSLLNKTPIEIRIYP